MTPTQNDLDTMLAGLVADHLDLADIAADPGTELVCLPDDLTLGGLEIDYTAERLELFAAAGGLTHSYPALVAAVWPQYEWASWLADVLRAAGCHVIEHPGWKTRGRPRSVGRWQPRGVMWHHDASKPGPSPYVARFLAEIGRPDEGIPAPLSQCWVCMGCNGAHPVGTWHVIAAGRCNHAGEGAGWGGIGADAGNAMAIGVETDNTTGEATPSAMYAALVRGTAAIMLRLRSSPAQLLTAHKEYARGRKTDPDDVDMPRARVDVAHAMRPPAPRPPAKPPAKPPVVPPAKLVPFPGVKAFRVGRRHKAVTQLDRWLIAAGFTRHHDGNGYQAGPRFTEWTRLNVAEFQRSEPRLRMDPDGIPGPLTWQLLQERVRVHQLGHHQ